MELINTEPLAALQHLKNVLPVSSTGNVPNDSAMKVDFMSTKPDPMFAEIAIATNKAAQAERLMQGLSPDIAISHSLEKQNREFKAINTLVGDMSTRYKNFDTLNRMQPIIEMSKRLRESLICVPRGGLDLKMFNQFEKTSSCIQLVKRQALVSQNAYVTIALPKFKDSYSILGKHLLGNDLIMRQMKSITDIAVPLKNIIETPDLIRLAHVIKEQMQITDHSSRLTKIVSCSAEFDIGEVKLPEAVCEFAGCCQLHELSFAAIENELRRLVQTFAHPSEIPEHYRSIILGVEHKLRVCREILSQYWNQPVTSFIDRQTSVAIINDVVRLQTSVNEMTFALDGMWGRLFTDFS